MTQSSVKTAPVTAQHEGHAADEDCPLPILPLPDNNLLPARVLHVHADGRSIGHVPQAAGLRRDGLRYILLLHLRSPHEDVRVPAGRAS